MRTCETHNRKGLPAKNKTNAEKKIHIFVGKLFKKNHLLLCGKKKIKATRKCMRVCGIKEKGLFVNICTYTEICVLDGWDMNFILPHTLCK